MTSRLTLTRRVAGAALVLAAACIGGSLPARELYRLDLSAAAAERPSPAPAPAYTGPVVVPPYATPGVYAGPQIVYRVGDTEYGEYPSREWAIPLSSMLASTTVDVLRNGSFAADVSDDDAAPDRQAIEWRGAVREFEEVIRGRRVFAVVHLDASLVRASDDSVLWRGAVRLERPVENPTMGRIVSTLSTLTGAAVTQLAQQAMPVVGAAVAAAKRTAP